MTSQSLHVSEWIDRSAAEVYDYASDPAHLVHWAAGLGGSVENEGGQWFMDTPGGQIRVTFVERNPFGVLDHDVTLPTGEVIHVPMRVIPAARGCEVVLTVRPLPGMGEAELTRDAALVAADLATLKNIIEAGP
jgi:hypothetical protein